MGVKEKKLTEELSDTKNYSKILRNTVKDLQDEIARLNKFNRFDIMDFDK